MDRLNLEARSHERMGGHLATASRTRSAAADRYRSKNERWAGRAEMAAEWRNQKQREKIGRSSSAIELKERKMKDFLSWQKRVLYEAPQQELERRNSWMA